MDINNSYKKLFKYRRWIAGCLTGALILNKGLPVIFPESLFMPLNAETNIDNFSFEHAAWLVRTTRHDMELTNVVFPFISKRSNCHCAGIIGWPKVTQTPVIGIPKFYFCNNVFEVEALEIKLDDSGKIVDSAGGPNELAFLESLTMSNSVQKFDIAKQLSLLNGNWAFAHTFLSPIFVLVGYMACFPGLKLLFTPGKSVSLVRIFQWQALGVVITWILCKLAKNLLSYIMVKSSDRQAASLSKEYAHAALEFCENNRKTNKALRVLLGKKGERLYSVDGDYTRRLFRSEPTLQERERYLKEILYKFDQDNQISD